MNRITAIVCLFAALLTTSIRPAHSDPVPAMTTQSAVQYTVSGTPELMDIYSPQNTAKPLPVIVYIHGGGWVGGSRLGADGYATHFTGKGYVFCSIDYRLAGVAKYPAQIEDCKCAI